MSLLSDLLEAIDKRFLLQVQQELIDVLPDCIDVKADERGRIIVSYGSKVLEKKPAKIVAKEAKEFARMMMKRAATVELEKEGFSLKFGRWVAKGTLHLEAFVERENLHFKETDNFLRIERQMIVDKEGKKTWISNSKAYVDDITKIGDAVKWLKSLPDEACEKRTFA